MWVDQCQTRHLDRFPCRSNPIGVFTRATVQAMDSLTSNLRDVGSKAGFTDPNAVQHNRSGRDKKEPTSGLNFQVRNGPKNLGGSVAPNARIEA